VNNSPCQIENIENELGSTGLLLKTVQSRLEERKARPGQDLVSDVPQDALMAEERQLRDTRYLLRDQLARCR